MNAKVRQFDSGATRNLDDGKFDYEGFLSPLVLERYAQYMHKHRHQADGTLRDSDNWQKGIPLPVYMKSGYRHFFDWWKEHRDIPTADGLEDAICALIFNATGYLHERLKQRQGLRFGGEKLSLNQYAASQIASATIMAHVPPYLERDADDELGLKAGEAVSFGGTD